MIVFVWINIAKIFESHNAVRGEKRRTRIVPTPGAGSRRMRDESEGVVAE